MPILFDPTTGHRRDKGREKSVNRQRKDCSILIRSVGGMRRRSTNQVLSGLFSTSSDKEIRSKSCFASLMEPEEKIAATLAGTQVAAAYPVAGACAATMNKEKSATCNRLLPAGLPALATTWEHLPGALTCGRSLRASLPDPSGPCHNLGAPAWSTHLRHRAALRFKSPSSR